MISFPNAKINLGLNITSKRPDGFHNIESCFLPIKLKDVLEIIPSDSTTFSFSGLPIPGNSSENLCIKAYNLLKTEFNLPAVHIHLHKIIPMGAGLGGGSSDAAFTLISLNEQFQLQIKEDEMLDYARKLGSDCAFFIKNSPVFASEKGDVFNEVSVDLKGKFIAVIYPCIHVSTVEAYSEVVPQLPEENFQEILTTPIQQWKNKLKNDFEKSVFKKYPEIKSIKDKLYSLDASFASMSGSGSSVFGIFEEEVDILQNFPANYFIWQGEF